MVIVYRYRDGQQDVGWVTGRERGHIAEICEQVHGANLETAECYEAQPL